MGMFDEIRVEVMLPDNTPISDTWYQTKSFECLLDQYVITANGELYKEIWDREWEEDTDAFFGGRFKRIEDSYRREYLTNFHGDINFYSSTPENSVDRTWRNYYARFTNGKLQEMWFEDSKY